MIPESNNLNDYLKADDVVETDHPRVLETVKALVQEDADEVQTARVLYEWVRDTIPHSGDIGSSVVTCSASEVLEQGTGMCFSKSHLLVALLRAAQIPSGFCYQVLMNDPPDDRSLVLHGLVGIYLKHHRTWAVVDPRGNTGGLSARFSIPTPCLAFAMDPEAGEYLKETVHVSPLPEVIGRLKQSESRDVFDVIRPESLKKTKKEKV